MDTGDDGRISKEEFTAPGMKATLEKVGNNNTFLDLFLRSFVGIESIYPCSLLCSEYLLTKSLSVPAQCDLQCCTRL